MTLQIRSFTPADTAAVRDVHVTAFSTPVEAELVKALHAGGHAPISLVAEEDGKIVGHILFSRLSLQIDDRPISALALAPVAVRPEYQKSGVGSALIRAGHDQAQRDGWEASIVLGEPAYYRKFGYDASAVAHIASPYAGEYLMGLELAAGALRGENGTMTYAEPFAALG